MSDELGRVQNEIGPQSSMYLTRAVLVYSNRGIEHRGWSYSSPESHITATVHDVQKGIIQPGEPLTREMLEDLVQGLNQTPAPVVDRKAKKSRGERSLESGLLPTTVLSISLTKAIWWCPSARRKIHFKADDKYDSLNGETVLHPPMLFWVENARLRAFALASNSRPQLTTRLYQAPYFNTNGHGTMCQGNVRYPKTITPASLAGFEAAFFDTFFTHATAKVLSRHPRGHMGFWTAMKRARRVPKGWLMATNWMIADALAGRLTEGGDEQPEQGQE